MLKKELAISFLKMAGSGNVKEAYHKFIALDFIHHNQYFKGDRQSLWDVGQAIEKDLPNENGAF